MPSNITNNSLIQLNDNPNLLTYKFIGIKPNQLTANKSYSINCSITQQSKVNQSALFIITVNNPPTAGSLLVYPAVGIEYSTYFTIQLINWTDIEGDYPLQYEVGYKRVGDDTVYSLDSYVTSYIPQYSYQLPAGYDYNGNQLEIIVYVYDTIGSLTTVSTIIRVTPVADRNVIYSIVSNKLNLTQITNEAATISALQMAASFIKYNRLDTNAQAIIQQALNCNNIFN